MQRLLFTTDLDPSRGRASPESRDAWLRLHPALSDARKRGLAEVQAAGPGGLTAKELAERWGVGLNTISGRFSELMALGLIRKTGSRREGAAVLIAGGGP